MQAHATFPIHKEHLAINFTVHLNHPLRTIELLKHTPIPIPKTTQIGGASVPNLQDAQPPT